MPTGQILVLSFSRSAVRTLTRRLATLSNPFVIEELRHVAIRTFDSWAFRILRLAGARSEDLLSGGHDKNIETLTGLIRGSRREEIRQLIGNKKCIIVDEFQDLPGVRGDLVLALFDLIAPPGAGGAGFTVLGDPAQAIFGFAGRLESAGAEARTAREYWQDIRTRYGGELNYVKLTRNYRATPTIAKISDEMRAILAGDTSEADKLAAIKAKLDVLPSSAPLHPDLLAPTDGSRAILTRNNGEALRVLQELLGDSTVAGPTPVRLRAAGHVAIPPAWIAALLRELKAPQLPQAQFLRIYAFLAQRWSSNGRPDLNLPPAEICWSRLVRASGGSDDGFIDISTLRARLFWPDSFPDDQHAPDDGLVVTTIHQSKGMEFDIVTLLETQRETEADNAAALEEEASVAYVAVTRAAQTITRLPPDSIYRAPTYRSFGESRERLCHWRNGWVNLEMGIIGDIDPTGFADPTLHDGEAGVQALQTFLLDNVRALEGHKVLLVKTGQAKETHYNIHLQDDRRPGRLIGRTTKQIPRDLLSLVWDHGYYLPGWIMNLRISTIGTHTGPDNGTLAEPERTSRLWLGAGLCGTGDFKPKKRS